MLEEIFYQWVQDSLDEGYEFDKWTWEGLFEYWCSNFPEEMLDLLTEEEYEDLSAVRRNVIEHILYERYISPDENPNIIPRTLQSLHKMDAKVQAIQGRASDAGKEIHGLRSAKQKIRNMPKLLRFLNRKTLAQLRQRTQELTPTVTGARPKIRRIEALRAKALANITGKNR